MGCEFLKPLVDAMREPDPKRRLSISEVVERYGELISSLWWWQLRARVIPKKTAILLEPKVANWPRWFFNTVGHIVTLKYSLPRPHT